MGFRGIDWCLIFAVDLIVDLELYITCNSKIKLVPGNNPGTRLKTLQHNRHS